MSKTYKGYELIKAIADREIKEGTKFKDLTSNNHTDNRDIYRYENENFIGRWGGTNILKLLNHNFELIEDEIDIQSIEEYPKILRVGISEENIKKVLNDIIDNQNELLEAVKQLDKNKEDKQC